MDNEAIQAKRLSGNKSGRGTFRRAKKNDAELFSGGTVEAFAGGMARALKRSDKRPHLPQANAEVW
ncbi:hypothetical protein [Pseudomonas sp.]|uniref:hypothetical protein n=1 Tax=Pseudomonas sp. TaxID=306 RepID=UPI0028AC1E6A|nr:hypothetical protein [Pseudomonas sp.]